MCSAYGLVSASRVLPVGAELGCIGALANGVSMTAPVDAGDRTVVGSRDGDGAVAETLGGAGIGSNPANAGALSCKAGGGLGSTASVEDDNSPKARTADR